MTEESFRTISHVRGKQIAREYTEPIVRLVVESVDAEWVSHVVNTLQNI